MMKERNKRRKEGKKGGRKEIKKYWGLSSMQLLWSYADPVFIASPWLGGYSNPCPSDFKSHALPTGLRKKGWRKERRNEET